MAQVFEASSIGSIRFKNRIIRSATHEGYGGIQGQPLEGLAEVYVRLAKGGVGGIITGIAGVHPRGRVLGNMIMADSDGLVEHYRSITEKVHEFGTPIIMQLVHAGRQTNCNTINGLSPLAPSAIRDKMYFRSKPQEMTEGDIWSVVDCFANAIERAHKAGFDGVQLHGAHGFLLSQFLSPYMNRRRDKWGANTSNRVRIIVEILEKARNKVGQFPILIKLNGYDHRPNGMNKTEAVRIAKLLEDAGCNAIEVSSGVMEDGFATIRVNTIPVMQILDSVPDFKNMNPLLKLMMRPIVPKIMPKREPIKNYNLSAAESIKQAVSIPVIVVGGVRDMATIQDVIQNDKADYVSMARPFIMEPDIVDRFRKGTQLSSRCKSCAQCYLKSVENNLRCYGGNV